MARGRLSQMLNGSHSAIRMLKGNQTPSNRISHSLNPTFDPFARTTPSDVVCPIANAFLIVWSRIQHFLISIAVIEAMANSAFHVYGVVFYFFCGLSKICPPILFIEANLGKFFVMNTNSEIRHNSNLAQKWTHMNMILRWGKTSSARTCAWGPPQSLTGFISKPKSKPKSKPPKPPGCTWFYNIYQLTHASRGFKSTKHWGYPRRTAQTAIQSIKCSRMLVGGVWKGKVVVNVVRTTAELLIVFISKPTFDSLCLFWAHRSKKNAQHFLWTIPNPWL